MNEIPRQPSVLLFLTLAVRACDYRAQRARHIRNLRTRSALSRWLPTWKLDIDYAVHRQRCAPLIFLQTPPSSLCQAAYQTAKIFTRLPVTPSQPRVTGIVMGCILPNGWARNAKSSLARVQICYQPHRYEITCSIGGIPAIAATVIIAAPSDRLSASKMLKNTSPSSVGMSFGAMASHAMGLPPARTQPPHGGIRGTGADVQRKRTDRADCAAAHPRFGILTCFRRHFSPCCLNADTLVQGEPLWLPTWLKKPPNNRPTSTVLPLQPPAKQAWRSLAYRPTLIAEAAYSTVGAVFMTNHGAAPVHIAKSHLST